MIKIKSKLMTLQEAAKLCEKKGDKIHSANGEYSILFEHFGQHGGFVVSELLRCEEWYFEPVEPEVLTADEYAKNIHIDGNELNSLLKSLVIGAFIEGDQTGQLKQWLKDKGLIGCIGDNIEALANDGYECIVEYYKNLKPFKPE